MGEPDPAERWKVVDKDGTAICSGMYRKSNAQREADELNRTGLVEFRPYTVERDTPTEP